MHVRQIMHGTHYKDIQADTLTMNTAKKLQKQSIENRHINALQTSTGQIIHDTIDIVNEIRAQYEVLYTKQNTDAVAQQMLLSTQLPTLDEQSSEKLGLTRFLIRRNKSCYKKLSHRKKSRNGRPSNRILFNLYKHSNTNT